MFFKGCLFTLLLVLFCSACQDEHKPVLFELMDAKHTQVDFQNDLPYTEDFNTYTYRNFYNGGGVALGDINNDGLVDIFFTGNIVDNKLYLNKGNWRFEDITAQAGVACSKVWSSGATMVDINADGLLDIYVCKAGKPGGANRHNELFINQGDLTFKEESKAYGLDIVGLSIHSAFFDYDKDGDLDCYLLNNSIRAVGKFDLKEGLRDVPDPEGNRFLRNDNGVFVDVSTEAGIYSSNIGYGLGITLSDFNEDNWTDIFISNDFFERDYLYINNQDGTFKEIGTESFSSMSMGSMGADACDIDNDLKPDLFVTEMLPHTLERRKTKAQYESWDKYKVGLRQGYHHQFTRNSLQRNMGNGQFVELGRYAGVAATEWSWASLIQDFDNDGLKDLFISNGIYKDLLDRDYLNFFADDIIGNKEHNEKKNLITTLVDSMPSYPVQNFLYKNMGDFVFENIASESGLSDLTYSNGSAYADLDNDGDLDLVVNNVNMPSFIYQNTTDTSLNKSIQFELVGVEKNSEALGAKVIIKYDGKQAMYEHYTSKGFESTVDGRIHFGLGDAAVVDSVIVDWPNGKQSVLTQLATNQVYKIEAAAAAGSLAKATTESSNAKTTQAINFKHKSLLLNLFTRERLLLEMSGFTGPAIAVADVNGDGREDVFLGGGKQQANELYLSQKDGNYQLSSKDFETLSKSETVDAVFFDSDKDGDQDLYIAHGGKSFSQFSAALEDVLLINDGNGNFTEKKNALKFPHPSNTGKIAIADLDKDGLLDIVVTESMKNDLFGLPANCFLFKNNGNNDFQNISSEKFEQLGMISAVAIADIDQDGWEDICLIGKWMPLTVLFSNEGSFQDPKSTKTYPNTIGLWNTIEVMDLDNDGDDDLICGNIGLNNFYNKDMRLYISDFDKNGSAEQLYCYKENGVYYPVLDFDELFSQLPSLKKKYSFYREYAKASVKDLFEPTALAAAEYYDLEEQRSMVYLNEGGSFIPVPLPGEIQYSSVYAIHGQKEGSANTLYFGGNSYQVKPQMGRLDGSLGWSLSTQKEGGGIAFGKCKSLYISGQIRTIQPFESNLIVGINGDWIQIIEDVYE